MPALLAPTREVTMDFIYADWCPHCQAMKPVVSDLEQKLPPGRFAVRYWGDAERAAGNSTVVQVYSYYYYTGFFTGYPAFIINNNDSRVGEMGEGDFLAWVCSKFNEPRPSACGK